MTRTFRATITLEVEEIGVITLADYIHEIESSICIGTFQRRDDAEAIIKSYEVEVAEI